MTKIRLISGDVYTELSVAEVRSYLQRGSKGGTIPGYLDTDKTTPILIAVQSIEYIYE
jgi:hypothetical protein